MGDPLAKFGLPADDVGDDPLAKFGVPADEAAPEEPAPSKVVELDPIKIEGEAPRMSHSEAIATGERNPFELGDEATGFGAWLASKFPAPWESTAVAGDVPRAAGRGMNAPLDPRSEYEANRDFERYLQHKAEADRPGDYRSGQMLQETIATAPSLIGAPLVMAGRGAAAAAPTLARAAYGGAVQGGALGSLTGAGASEADNPTGVVADAGRGALVGAATGAAAPYVIAGAGKLAGAGADLAKRGADALRSKANVNRLAASGTYGAQLRNIMQNKGEDAVQELGEEIERLGIHKGKPLLGVIPNPWPQPPKTYADNSERVLADAGRRMGAAEGAIAQAGDPPIDVGSIDAGLRAGADDVATGFDPSSKGEAGFMRDFADRIDAAGKPGVEIGPSTGKVPFSQALKERRRIDANIDWTRKGGYEGAGMQEQVRRGVAGDLRAATREGLDEAVARGELDPKTVEAWKQANKDYATAATVHDPAVARVYQEYGNQKIGLPGWLAATSGAASGGPLGAVGGALVGQLAKSRGTPLLAGTQRAGQRLLSGASNALSAAGTLAPTVQPEIGGVAAARAAERAVENKFPAGFASPAHAQSPGDAQLDRSADLALQDPTEPHAQALAQKQGDDRRTAYSVLIHTDPEFRARQKQRAKQQQEQQERTQEQ